MSAKYIKIHPENPQEDKIAQVVDCLRNGGVIAYPTDTVYGFACDPFKPKAVEKIRQIKDVKAKKLNYAFVFSNLSELSKYAKVNDNATFKIIKKVLPGAFTFILESSAKFPKIFQEKKKQVGIRMPAALIPREIVRMLGNPIITTSVRADDGYDEYTTDPELIFERYGKKIDMVVDGGLGYNVPSTIVDFTVNDGEFVILREGLGDSSLLY